MYISVEYKPYSIAVSNIKHYYPYRAFGGQNKIVYSTRFVRREIFFNIARAIFY